MNTSFPMSPVSDVVMTSAHAIFGFTDLLKTLHQKLPGIYLPTDDQDPCLSSQEKIQKQSYTVLAQCFSNPLSLHTESMQIYLAKIDIDEINQGFIDLSPPHMQHGTYAGWDQDYIYRENEKILSFLKFAFSPALQSTHLYQQILEMEKFVGNENADNSQRINQFLDIHNKIIQEVILFCEVLGLICVSQSLYAFCFQLSKNSNFAQLIELILWSGNSAKYAPVYDLAKRYFSVFIGHLTVRVFNEQTLAKIETALVEE